MHRLPIMIAAVALATQSTAQTPAFDPSEKSVAELTALLAAGTITSRQLTEAYLARIDAYDRRGPAIDAMIAINPRALEDADALDRERAARGPRGPLHGVPNVIKDNYDP